MTIILIIIGYYLVGLLTSYILARLEITEGKYQNIMGALLWPMFVVVAIVTTPILFTMVAGDFAAKRRKQTKEESTDA